MSRRLPSVSAKAIALLVIVLLGMSTVTGLTQIRKPTQANDLEGATADPGNATDFSTVFDSNTSAVTAEPTGNASVNWTDWDTTGIQPYTTLSITVTANASDFQNNEWGVFVDNTTGTTCDSLDHPIRDLDTGGSGTVQNFTTVLPKDQDLSLLDVCLVGEGIGLDINREVYTWDIRTNGSVDTTAPRWRNREQNRTRIVQGDPVELAAQGRDNLNLSHALLATNETGAWTNKSGTYSSPQRLYTQDTWAWSNFTWDNASVTAGQTVGWRIWYNDTAGNYNSTRNRTVTLRPPMLNVSLRTPPTPFTATANQAFTMNATATCRFGDCGTVNATARYNASSPEPDTAIPVGNGEPFYTAAKENPLVCDAVLDRGERCNVTWAVNATGGAGSQWLIDVNFTAPLETVRWNATADTNIEISAFAIDIALQWDVIDFGALHVGETDNPAVNNSDGGYNITVTGQTTENVDLWTNMTSLTQEDGDDIIGASNMSVSTTDDPVTADSLTPPFSLLRSDVDPGTNVTTYYWLDTPLGIFADNYTGTLWVKANATA
jgi:hypothetical protein